MLVFEILLEPRTCNLKRFIETFEQLQSQYPVGRDAIVVRIDRIRFEKAVASALLIAQSMMGQSDVCSDARTNPRLIGRRQRVLQFRQEFEGYLDPALVQHVAIGVDLCIPMRQQLLPLRCIGSDTLQKDVALMLDRQALIELGMGPR